MPLALKKSYCGGRYKLCRRLDRGSEGAYSAVYLADDRGDQRSVAVKESTAQTETGQRRFERERRIQERLSSPYLVRVLGDETFGSSRCLVLEYLPGGSLAQDAVRAGLSEEQKAAIVADVLRGLAAAHAEGVVHRDALRVVATSERPRSGPSCRRRRWQRQRRHGRSWD